MRACIAISLTCAFSVAAADPITKPDQVDPPKIDASKTGTSTAGAAKTDASKRDASKTDASKVDASKTVAPKSGTSKSGASKSSSSKKSVSKTTTKKPAAKSQARKADGAKAKKPDAPASSTSGDKQITTTSASKSESSKSDRWRFSAPKDADQSAAYKYGMMAWPDCEAELAKRKIAYVKESPTRGVVQPIRLTGPLHGVLFRTDESDKVRPTTPYEIADCRLVLALDDFAEVLVAHDIVEVRHYSMYRAPDKSWPADKPGTRHNGALAIDAARFKDSTGKELDVDKHFNGAIDDKTCGDGAAPHPATADAIKLRSILCDAWDKHIFNVALTPNYNKPHHNHFHLEVTSGVKWFLLH